MNTDDTNEYQETILILLRKVKSESFLRILINLIKREIELHG